MIIIYIYIYIYRSSCPRRPRHPKIVSFVSHISFCVTPYTYYYYLYHTYMSTKEEDEPTKKCVEASDGVKALVEKKEKGHKVLTWRTGTSFWE
jgi:hypothetical protein